MLKLPPLWREALISRLDSTYFTKLFESVEREYQEHVVYPPQELIFRAYELTPPESVRVVIVGQDPYHQPHQANGLAFCTGASTPMPPSLKNIYKELKSDLGCTRSVDKDLIPWAESGVLLLNMILSVRESEPMSHKDLSWEALTDESIKFLSQNRSHIVFILWGKEAQKKASYIDSSKHCILQSSHPSPLSAYRGFFGSKVFSRCNRYLKKHSRGEIEWC